MQTLQKTFGQRDDVILYIDDTVTVDGQIVPDAIVTDYEGAKRIALNSAEPSMLQVNAIPAIARIEVVREPGWQGALGWRASLLDLVQGDNPGVIALAVYQHPEAKDYLFTTGAFIFNEQTQLWNTVCPPGHEPEHADVNFSMLYASIVYSPFTLWSEQDSIIVETGGDIPT